MEAKWWTTFPRKIGIPHKTVCLNSSEFIGHYRHYNGVAPKLYIALYSCDPDGEMTNTTIDVVGFDCDGARGYDTMVSLHNYLTKVNYKHLVMFSTGGYWIYLLTKPKTFPKAEARGRLTHIHTAIAKEANLEWGKSKTHPLDISIMGDVERLTRMPGSYDVERQRYAIFLSEEDILLGHDHVVSVSAGADLKRRYSYFTFGKIEVDPSSYDPMKVPEHRVWNIETEEYTFDIPDDISDTHRAILETLPDCVKAWVVNAEDATWEARAFATLYFREKGFTKEQTESFLKPFYEKHLRTDKWKNNWEHYKHSAQTSDNIYRRSDLKFPNCANLSARGLCRGHCMKNGKYHSLVYRPSHNQNI